MNITRKAYDVKPLLIKQGALFLWGIHLTRWTDSRYTHHLYRLNDFYVEMCCDRHTSRLVRIVTFTSPHQLLPNLGRMNLAQVDRSV